MLSFLKSLLRRRNDFFPFERAILDAVFSRMTDETRMLLLRQVEVINTIQRLSDGKEVNLYRTRLGKADFDNTLRLPNSPTELLIATVHLKKPSSKTTLKADVWMAEGRLFSLEFNISPKRFFENESLSDVRPEIVDVEILCDQFQ